MENSKVYKPHLPMMQIMFGACLRVSETIGLTWSDVDMKNREIHVGGQLVYYEGDEGYCFHDSETKTDAGIRTIPMTQTVYDAFRKQKELNLMLGLQSNVEIGGRSGFIFNTPVLIGEPGVGKTAVIEGLAQRIVKGMYPTA